MMTIRSQNHAVSYRLIQFITGSGLLLALSFILNVIDQYGRTNLEVLQFGLPNLISPYLIIVMILLQGITIFIISSTDICDKDNLKNQYLVILLLIVITLVSVLSISVESFIAGFELLNLSSFIALVFVAGIIFNILSLGYTYKIRSISSNAYI